jgi:acetate kinase
MAAGSCILTINAGSSSLKFALFDVADGAPQHLCHGLISRLDGSPLFEAFDADNSCLFNGRVSLADHEHAVHHLLDWLGEQGSLSRLAAVGHRVVHGGIVYSAPVRVDKVVLGDLHSLIPLAPLHMPHHIAAIRALFRVRPELPQVACFDTAFHRGMVLPEQKYALPGKWFERGIRRYGFHGLSYEYIAGVLEDMPEIDADSNTVVAHLGYGASLCAMRNGRSVATTMGFTPLDGIPMATRPGALDPGVTLWLIREARLTPDEIGDMFNHNSGLLGLSGISGDMQTLLQSDHPSASEAVDYFVHHTHRAIASMAATLGGIDTLVFTGGIGENAVTVRRSICQRAEWLGIDLDIAANEANQALLSTRKSPVSVWRIPTNEELMIARHVQQTVLLNGKQRPG